MLSLRRDSLTTQLETSLTKADSEQLARSIAEEQYSDLEKEKIMKELEIKDMMARHKQELGDKEATISSVSSIGSIAAICDLATRWQCILHSVPSHTETHLNKRAVICHLKQPPPC